MENMTGTRCPLCVATAHTYPEGHAMRAHTLYVAELNHSHDGIPTEFVGPFGTDPCKGCGTWTDTFCRTSPDYCRDCCPCHNGSI